jgi:hypothetical protein
MKYLIFLFAILTLVSCKEKDKEEVTPGYADGLVGTYVGQETAYGTNGSTVTYNNASATFTVTKLEKNKIKLSSFNSGPSVQFTLTQRADGNIELIPISWAAHGSGNNVYFNSVKQLNVYVKDGVPSYYSFQGTKQ